MTAELLAHIEERGAAVAVPIGFGLSTVVAEAWVGQTLRKRLFGAPSSRFRRPAGSPEVPQNGPLAPVDLAASRSTSS